MSFQRHLPKRFLIVGLASVLLAGCAMMETLQGPPEPTRDYTPDQAASLPDFGVGDRFRFDNQDMTWQVVNVGEDKIHWQSDTGELQVTSRNPLLPAIEWQSPARGKGKRLISNLQGSFFPLKTGNSIQFKTTVNTDKPPYAWEFDWTCLVAGEEQVEIEMGLFDTFRVECSRQEPEKWIFYYAPRIGYYVKMEATGLKNGRSSSRVLMGYVRDEVAYGDVGVAMAIAKTAPTDEVMVNKQEIPVMEQSMAKSENEVMAETMTKPAAEVGKLKKEDMVDAPKPKEEAPKVAAVQPKADGYLIHLASFKREVNAQRGQADLKKKFAADLGGMTFSSKRVDLGTKGIYYRLYAGPASSRGAANELCRKLKAKGQYCAVKKAP